MERFVASVADEVLRERLLIAIDGKGAFRRFKNVLLAYPAERERWFNYRSALLRFQIQSWFEQMHLSPASPPPWGRVEPPPDPEPVADALHATGDTPGEILRRQARRLLDGIPTAELPSAMAFLEFLKERGAAAYHGEEEEDRPRLTNIKS
jgi:hypothetical protein